MVLSMDRWKNKIVVVTGASAGIGAAIVRKLLDLDLIVVGLARRKEKIQELSVSKKLHAIKCDITKEIDILNAFKWIEDNLGPIHIFINNAGVARVTNLIDGKTEFWKDVFDTNVMGLCIATREAVKSMRKNSIDGHIVHISSIFGHKVVPFENLNVLCASKYAITALTETLRQELNSIGSKIKISSVSPGITKTDAIEAACLASGTSEATTAYRESTKGAPALNPSDVADAVVYILSTPPHVQVHDLWIKPLGEGF